MAGASKRRKGSQQDRRRRKGRKRRKEDVSVSVDIYIDYKLEILMLNAQGQITALKEIPNISLGPPFMEYDILITAKCLS